MAQLHDDEQVDVSVRAVDAKGFEVDVDLSATVEDTTVATVQELEDGRTFRVIAGNPGSTIVHVTTGELEATLAVDVVPGDVALVQLTVGDPVKQAPADQPPTV